MQPEVQQQIRVIVPQISGYFTRCHAAFSALGRHITLLFYPLASLQLHAQKMVAYSNMRIVRILSYRETALVQVRNVASKKQLAVYSGRAKYADGFISSLIFVKGWLIGPGLEIVVSLTIRSSFCHVVNQQSTSNPNFSLRYFIYIYLLCRNFSDNQIRKFC